MGLSLGGIGNLLGNAIVPATEAVAAHNIGQQANRKQQLAEAIQAAAQRREQEKEDLANAIGQSTIGRNNATATAAGRTPVKYSTDADNNVVGLPTKVDGTAPVTPLQTGVTALPKPVHIDPNSAEGIAAAGQKAQGAAKARAQNPVPKQGAASEPVVKTQNPDGSVIYTARSQAPGKAAPAATGAAAASGQTMQTMARMGTSYNDLKQAIDQMDTYENTPGNLASQTPFKQVLGVASEVHPSAESHGLMSGVNNMAGAFLGAKAGQKLGQDDPEYRTYLNNKQRVATAFTELLPRPNQQLLQLEKGLSGADVSWNPQLIKNIQARRRGGLDVLKNILGQQGMLDAQGNMSGTRQTPSRGAAHDPGDDVNLGGHAAAATPAQQLWDAAVAKHGQAKVLQEYGPRPDGEE